MKSAEQLLADNIADKRETGNVISVDPDSGLVSTLAGSLQATLEADSVLTPEQHSPKNKVSVGSFRGEIEQSGEDTWTIFFSSKGWKFNDPSRASSEVYVHDLKSITFTKLPDGEQRRETPLSLYVDGRLRQKGQRVTFSPGGEVGVKQGLLGFPRPLLSALNSDPPLVEDMKEGKL